MGVIAGIAIPVLFSVVLLSSSLNRMTLYVLNEAVAMLQCGGSVNQGV